jgi:hypothetical protein
MMIVNVLRIKLLTTIWAKAFRVKSNGIRYGRFYPTGWLGFIPPRLIPLGVVGENTARATFLAVIIPAWAMGGKLQLACKANP